MANNFVSYDNLDAILKDFNSKGVKVIRQTTEPTQEQSAKYGLWIKTNPDDRGIYYRVESSTTPITYTWSQISSGGLGDAKTGYVEKRFVPGSTTDYENYLHLGYWDDKYPGTEKPFDWRSASDGELEEAFGFGMWHDANGFVAFRVPAGGGGGSSDKSIIDYTNKVLDDHGNPTYEIVTALGGDTYIKFSATSINKQTQQPTGNYQTYIYKSDRELTEAQVSQLEPIDYRGSCVQGEDQTFNIKDNLSKGKYYFYVRIVDALRTTYFVSYNVSAYQIGLTWDMPTFTYYGRDSKVTNFQITSIPGKTTTLKITKDDEEFLTEVVEQTEKSVTIPPQSHGAHTFRAWIEVQTVSGTISTEAQALYRRGVWFEQGHDEPIVAFEKPEMTGTQYAVNNINVIAITPGSTESTVVITDGTTTRTVVIDTSVYTWNYVSTQTGTINITATTGSASALCVLTIESAGLVRQEFTQSLVMDVNPQGHTNEEEGIKERFGYLDRTTTEDMVPFEYSPNFDWVQGGFKQDPDNGNVTAFVIKKGTWIRFQGHDYQPNPRANGSLFLTRDKTSARDAQADKGNGKNIEIIFQTKNVENWDAELGQSYEAGKCGIKFSGHEVIFEAGNTLRAPYSENKLTEMCLNIKPQDDTANLADYSAMKLWLAGTPASAATYSDRRADGTSFAHTTGDPFKLGSNECDIWLYRFKMYTVGLTDSQIISNFVVDCPNPTERLERDKRNDIYETGVSGTIDKTKMMKNNPSLHVISIEAEEFPPTKGGDGKKKCKITHQINRGTRDNPVYPVEEQWYTVPKVDGGKTNYAQYTLQGTSSMNYREAAGNLDIDMKKCKMCYIDAQQQEKELEKGYKLYDNAVPEKYFNLKANVASSENANNACLVDLYNEYNPAVSRQKYEAQGTSKVVRDTNYGWPVAVFIKNTSTTQSLRLGVDGARVILPEQEILYFAGDFINSKKNTKTLGQTDFYNGQMCIEFAENNNKKCIFHELTDFADENWEFSASDWTDIKAMYPWINNPKNQYIRNEVLHTIGEGEQGQEVNCHVKYYIKFKLDDNPIHVEGEQIHEIALGETGRVTCHLANINIIIDKERQREKYPVIHTSAGTAATIVDGGVSADGTIIIDVTGCTPGAKVTCDYYYKKEIPEFLTVTDNATIINSSADGSVRIKINEGATTGDNVLVGYNFDRKDQFAIRYPEDEFLQGFYLVEGGIKREELKTDEHRQYFDFYTKAKQRFVGMQNFVASCAPFQKSDHVPCGWTGEDLPSPVTIGGVEYKKDTLDYRKAKFKSYSVENIYDWFNMDQVLFHYVFTEFFTMVDNRGKNLFCSWEEDQNGVNTNVTDEQIYVIKHDSTEKGLETNRQIYSVTGAETTPEAVEVNIGYENIDDFTLLVEPTRLVSINKKMGKAVLDVRGLPAGETFNAAFSFWYNAIRCPLNHNNVNYDGEFGEECKSFTFKVNGAIRNDIFRVYTEGVVYINPIGLNVNDVITISYTWRNHGTTKNFGWSFNFSKDYDNDTALGIDNKGKLVLSYGIESTDADNDGVYWFNASDNSLFTLVNSELLEDLTGMYITKERAGLFNAQKIINKFNSYQKVRPESLMADDAKGKYDDPITNITIAGNYNKNISFMRDMELGEKIDQRHLFTTFQEKYFASKYSKTATQKSSSWDTNVYLQSWGPGAGQVYSSLMTVTTYNNCYVEWDVDGQYSAGKARAKHDVPVVIQLRDADGNPLSKSSQSGETAIHCDNGASLKYVSSIARMYPGAYSAAGCSKLQNIMMGDTDPSYRGHTFDRTWTPTVDQVYMAKEIDLQGQTGVGGSLQLSSNPMLEKLNTINTQVSGVSFASGSPLSALLLGTKTETITATNIENLQTFSIDSYNNLALLHLDNCHGFPIVELMEKSPRTHEAGLGGFELYVIVPEADTLNFDNCAVFKPVLDGTVIWTGSPNPTVDPRWPSRGYLKGNIHFGVIGTTEIAELNDYFEGRVNITYDRSVEGYSIYPVKYYNNPRASEIELIYTEYIESGTKTSDPVARGKISPAPSKERTNQYTYIYSGWDYDFNTPITATTTINVVYTPSLNSYKVKFDWNKGAGKYFHFYEDNVYTITGEETGPVEVQLKGNHIQGNPTFTNATIEVAGATAGKYRLNLTGSAGDKVTADYECTPIYEVPTYYGQTASYDVAEWGVPDRTDRVNQTYGGTVISGQTDVYVYLGTESQPVTPVKYLPITCKLIHEDSTEVECEAEYITEGEYAGKVHAMFGTGGSWVTAVDTDSIVINYAEADFLCTGFSKRITESSYITATQKFVVDDDLIDNYNCEVISDFEPIKLPSGYLPFYNLSWAQVVAIANYGHKDNSTPARWVTTNPEGTETVWFQTVWHGDVDPSVDDPNLKPVTLTDGTTYKIQAAGFMLDNYNGTTIPITFGTLNLSYHQIPYAYANNTEAWNDSTLRVYLNGYDKSHPEYYQSTPKFGQFPLYHQTVSSGKVFDGYWETYNGEEVLVKGVPFFNKLPMDLQQAIQTCCKQNQAPGVYTGRWSDVTYDKVFSPSPIEMGAISDNIWVRDEPHTSEYKREINRQMPQITYPIFGNTDSGTDTSRKKLDGAAGTSIRWMGRYTAINAKVVEVASTGLLVTGTTDGKELRYADASSVNNVINFPIFWCIGRPRNT